MVVQEADSGLLQSGELVRQLPALLAHAEQDRLAVVLVGHGLELAEGVDLLVRVGERHRNAPGVDRLLVGHRREPGERLHHRVLLGQHRRTDLVGLRALYLRLDVVKQVDEGVLDVVLLVHHDREVAHRLELPVDVRRPFRVLQQFQGELPGLDGLRGIEDDRAVTVRDRVAGPVALLDRAHGHVGLL